MTRITRFCFWITLAALLAAAAPLGAQVVRLPSIMPPSEPYPVELASRPDSPPLLPQPPLEMPPANECDRPPDARDGMFQKLIFTNETIFPSRTNGLGVNDLDLKMVLALPIPSRNWPLLITPGAAVHFLDHPGTFDLPSKVYDTYTQFRSLGRINPRLGAELAVTLGVYSDFEQDRDGAFRITGHVGTMWEWTSTTKLLVGAAYINTYDTDVIPIGGVIWEPHDDLTIEAVFPKPRIAHRLWWHGACTEETQDWVYLAGEWGNDTWAILRPSGATDEINYRDWKLLVGLERKAIGRLDAKLELGYVFTRKIHYLTTDAIIEPEDTVMIRGGLTY